MKLKSVSSFSPSKKLSTAKQNKKQNFVSLLQTKDTIAFSGNTKKRTGKIAALLALLSLLTAYNGKPANNNAAQSSVPNSAYIVTDYDSAKEKETQSVTHQVPESISKPTKIAVPPITYPITDIIEMIGGYTQHIHAKADELMEGIGATDEKVVILRQEAARLEAEALIAEAEAKEAQEKLEKDWEIYYTTGEGSKEDLDSQIMLIVSRRMTVERNRRYAEDLNKVADEVANGTYKSTNTKSPLTDPDTPTAPTDPTTPLSPDIYPNINTIGITDRYTQHIHARADKLMEGITSIDEKVQILRDEAARLEIKALIAEAEAKEAQEKLEKVVKIYYATGKVSTEDFDNQKMFAANCRATAERNRKYAEGLNKVADLVSENAYHSIANPPMPY